MSGQALKAFARNMAYCAFCALALGGAQANPVITSFDYPAADNTQASGIDSAGRIVGYYAKNGVGHGFRRSAAGAFLSLDPPGSVSTAAKSIFAGEIVGIYQTAIGGVTHGFLRHTNGTYVSFDVPGAIATVPRKIAGGWIAGGYVISSGHFRGFVRDPSGTISTFDPSGNDNTNVGGVNASGMVTGKYVISANGHGYLRDAAGNMTLFDPPNSNDTNALDISSSGRIVGYFGGKGFVRRPNGTYNLFNVPGIVHFTYPSLISPNAGWIAGQYGAGGMLHGFTRDSAGVITSFDPPGSTMTTSAGINNAGTVAGWYTDAANAQHGFVRTP